MRSADDDNNHHYVRNLIYVKGCVPENNGGVVRVTDARKRVHKDKKSIEIPFPTYLGDIPTSEVIAPHVEMDPFNYNL